MNEASARRLDIRAGGLELAGGDAVARLEAPDKVTLVDEPDRRRDLGGGLSLRQQAARDLQAPARQVGVRRQTVGGGEGAADAEPAAAGCAGEVLEAEIAVVSFVQQIADATDRRSVQNGRAQV